MMSAYTESLKCAFRLHLSAQRKCRFVFYSYFFSLCFQDRELATNGEDFWGNSACQQQRIATLKTCDNTWYVVAGPTCFFLLAMADDGGPKLDFTAVSIDKGMTELRAIFLSKVFTSLPFGVFLATFGNTSAGCLAFIVAPTALGPGSVDIIRQ